jgi:hypothetical protein
MKMRHYLMLLLVLGSVAMSGKASAFYQIPATAGRPGMSLSPSGWFWQSDILVKRSGASPAEWIVPLVFEGWMGSNEWTAKAFVSAGSACSIQWRPDDASGVLQPFGSAQVTASSDRVMTLTTSCPTGPNGLCITPYASAYVSCWINSGGFIGAVNYTITPVP